MPSNQNAKKTEGQHQTASKEGWDFSWSNYAFRDGEAENKRILGEFEDKYNALVKEADDEFGNEALLMKGLDLAVAFIKTTSSIRLRLYMKSFFRRLEHRGCRL